MHLYNTIMFLNNIYYEKTRELLEFYLNRPYKFILDKNNKF